jgi:hypothetical protein
MRGVIEPKFYTSLRQEMGQLHALSTSPPEKEPPVPRAGFKRGKVLSLSTIEPRYELKLNPHKFVHN